MIPSVEIPLTRGFTAIVDSLDAERVSQHTWVATTNRYTVYAHAMIDGERVGLHRLILNPDKDVQIDHIDGDGLNNTRANLRICTSRENMRNRRKIKSATSRFKGVWLSPHGWRATINSHGKHIHLGTFGFETDAARQYDRAARLMFGRFARTNEMMGLLPPRKRTDLAVAA